MFSQGSVKYQEYFLQTLLNSICDKQSEVRQAAVYGVGVMAMFGGEDYVSLMPGKHRLKNIIILRSSGKTWFMKVQIEQVQINRRAFCAASDQSLDFCHT